MYEVIIGLEVHVQLSTRSKVFCGCPTRFGSSPNTQTCPVCLGLPGTLPVLNKQALELAVRTALALNCSIQPSIKFDRKNYFYPDLPKNYQISQYDLPLSYNGYLDSDSGTGIKRIGIKRVHLEEDAGKLVHDDPGPNSSYVDYNRSGIPLLEIVSEPQINSPDEAYQYLTTLKSILKYLDVSDCDMEKGSLRCDANVSIRKPGEERLGVKTELKNMNSFKAVRQALEFEIKRQKDIKQSGKTVVQQTLFWDDKNEKTVIMRTKEEAHDYRYFPEPDLVPFTFKQEQIREIKNSLPELPRVRLSRFMKEYGLSDYEANILISDRYLSVYFEECAKLYKNYKRLINWIMGPFLFELNARKIEPVDLTVSPADLIQLLRIADEGKINNLTAKSVLTEMFNLPQRSPEVIIEEKNLMQISQSAVLEETVNEVMKNNEKPVCDYKNGKNNALMFLVGQVMKKTKGKANPRVVTEMLKERIKNA